ncbi:DUF995 domain-containing protein [Agrobacterium salinitolerans]|uniref:DUF995 domain-containing protein n=1 Tax=Agrobacterium salinitolerans TaxID=1183413 RepID=UPI00174C3795|nr:DUF995 domain-containing protein [Agrobacterium salinitolerans]
MVIPRSIIIFTVIGCFSATALADRLPKDAMKLTQAEAQALYAGKSSEWSRSNAYFSPDGSYFIVGKSGNFAGQGKWSARDNEVCAEFQGKSLKEGKIHTGKDCWTWYRQGKKYWALWSGEKDKVGGYYDGELKKLSNGDKVTKRYQEIMAKSN